MTHDQKVKLARQIAENYMREMVDKYEKFVKENPDYYVDFVPNIDDFMALLQPG